MKKLLILLPLCLAVPALAQEEVPILVIGGGLRDTLATPAYDVQDIDRDGLTSGATGRIEDVLGSIAGFQQFRRSDSRSANPSAQGVTLRALGGNASSRALVLLDGVPMADPFFGYIPFSALAPERLGHVRITRGGGAGAFGAGAVAGTIELTSASAQETGFFSGSVLANDRGDSEASATLSPQLGAGFASLSARWDNTQGFWTTPLAQRSAASVKASGQSWSTSLRVAAPLNEAVELQARGLIYDDRRTLRFAGADTSSSGQDASLRLIGRGDWQWEALGYVQARDFSNVVISSTSFKKTLDQRRTPSTGIGGKLELRPPLGDVHMLRLGADLRQSSGAMHEEAYSTDSGLVTARRRAGGRNSDIGLFAESDWKLGNLVLTAGLRGDRWAIGSGYFQEANAAGTVTTANRFADRQGWATSLRGGAVWRAGGGLSLRGAAYSGLRLPTLNELYRPFTVFPVVTRANAALANERLRGFDLGLDYAPSDNVSLSLTGFDNRVRSAIANVTIAANLRERRNVDALRAKGVEASAALRLGQFGFTGSMALTDAKVRASGISSALNGKRPAQTPKLAASGTLAWRPKLGWHIAATLRHASAQFEDDLQTDVLPATTTMDAFAEAPLGANFSLILRGENLTGEAIITRNQAGSIDLGSPRTIWAGLRLRY